VRWDGGIEVGSDVGLFYDPMLAKLIVYAGTRDAAIDRMHRALLELQIEGVETSREFHLRMMEDAEFRSGDITIQWLEAKLPALSAILPSSDDLRAAVIAAALMAERDRTAVRAVTPGVGAPDSSSAWQRAARLEGLRTA
jgi:acetyl/propionyl-CoA carboxylase alpha subunit